MNVLPHRWLDDDVGRLNRRLWCVVVQDESGWSRCSAGTSPNWNAEFFTLRSRLLLEERFRSVCFRCTFSTKVYIWQDSWCVYPPSPCLQSSHAGLRWHTPHFACLHGGPLSTAQWYVCWDQGQKQMIWEFHKEFTFKAREMLQYTIKKCVFACQAVYRCGENRLPWDEYVTT